jgi:hypothetical protein
VILFIGLLLFYTILDRPDFDDDDEESVELIQELTSLLGSRPFR